MVFWPRQFYTLLLQTISMYIVIPTTLVLHENDGLGARGHTTLVSQIGKPSSLYVENIARLRSVPSNIVSKRDPRFTSKFKRALEKASRKRWNPSITHHS